MSKSRKLQCNCGQMQWQVERAEAGTHLACYCKDCQTYVNHLDQAARFLNDNGGTELVQTVPSKIRILAGADQLRSLRLTPTGLLRWYAGCCNTPIANTLNTPGFPFVGMVLPVGAQGFGPLVAEVQTTAAKTPVRAHGKVRMGLGLLSRALMAKLRDGGKSSPFFDAAGAPVVAPVIVSEMHP
ncbi:DUF6151 family protein [Primorskyibacter sp. 2E107]|uniref:DUF6151 family protein n=1 Tax=Primorskyibacter sp. 2E107 TaxID=3403458 RepID=UPI003AF92537